METWDAIRARRNVRSFETRAIPESDLVTILQAGWRAPSASNRQPWDFVVCDQPDRLQELSTVWRGAGHVARSAATIALVLPRPEEERYRLMDQFDLGQATMAMALMAADLGIGSGHAAVEDQDACRRILGMPEDHYCAYLLALGYPADRPLVPIERPARRPFGEVVHRDGW
ncbi:MAG TPA: nitroreductase family protein [Acidimicrobiales bacterium]|nr:nitroreductase family protein [Acidimicrobiales bacterium]